MKPGDSSFYYWFINNFSINSHNLCGVLTYYMHNINYFNATAAGA